MDSGSPGPGSHRTSSRGAAPVLTIDRGNSTLDCLLTGAGPDRRAWLSPSVSALSDFLAGVRPARCAALTVVRDGLAPAIELLGDAILVAGRDLRCPLRLAYPEPRTLGADRWVGAVAARARHGDAIVVDCGTAVTVNLVTADGRFLGGAIGAGLGTLTRALATAAPALPPFDGEPPACIPSTTSLDAVRAGVGSGFAHLVRGLVADCIDATGLADATRVLTGGDASRAARFLGAGWSHEPDLVHAGLRCLLDVHDSKS